MQSDLLEGTYQCIPSKESTYCSSGSLSTENLLNPHIDPISEKVRTSTVSVPWPIIGTHVSLKNILNAIQQSFNNLHVILIETMRLPSSCFDENSATISNGLVLILPNKLLCRKLVFKQLTATISWPSNNNCSLNHIMRITQL